MRHRKIVEDARRRRATVLLAVVAALTAMVTAVGATGAVGPPAQLLDYQKYVGGKGKAKANLAPVTIGYINGQGGPPNFNFPQATSVIRAGVKMVNEELGGVHGHPLRLSECFWAQAEEEGVRCGQQMVNNKVKAIIYGFVTVGNQSIYATVKGRIPIVGVVTANPADPTARNAFFLNGSQTSVLGPFGTYTQRFHKNVQTVAIVYPNDPGAITAAAALQEGLAAGRTEGDDDRGAATGDRPDRSGDAGEPGRHDRRRARLHDVRAVRAGDRPDQLLEADPVDADLHVPPASGVRRRGHPEVDLRDRADAREPARPAVEALPEEGPPVRDERRRTCSGSSPKAPGKSCSRPCAS